MVLWSQRYATQLLMAAMPWPIDVAFNSVLLISKEETDKGGYGAFLWGCGGSWGWMISNKELDVLETEQCVEYVGSALAVFSRSQQEE